MTSGSIIVVARVRPQSSQERERGEVNVVNVESESILSIRRTSVYTPAPPSVPPPSPRISSPRRSDTRTSRPGIKQSLSPPRGRRSASSNSPSPTRNRGHSHVAQQYRNNSGDDSIASRMTFSFDAVFGSVPRENIFDSQELLYAITGRPILKSALNSVNACLFAYGQTGSGKTFSMMGTSEAPGVLHLLANELFEEKYAIEESAPCSEESASAYEGLQVGVAFLELYNERLVDLLAENGRAASTPLKIFENSREGVTVPGLSETEVHGRSEFGVLIDLAARSRAAGATRMNKNSSRSHAIVQLRLRRRIGDHLTQTKICIIDLAGSERPRTGFNGNTPNKDGISINVSLSALGLVISRLSDLAQGRGHCSVPFRDSKLTFLLKDALIGNAKTHILITLSPSASCFEESMSTLRFAQSAKRICARAVADAVKSPANKNDNRALQVEVECLRAELSSLREKCRCSEDMRSNSTNQEMHISGTDAIRRGDLFMGSSCTSFSVHQANEQPCGIGNTSGDTSVSEALARLNDLREDSLSLAKVHVSLGQVTDFLMPQAALEFIECLTRLCFLIDEANELLHHSEVSVATNNIMRLEVTWLSPGPNPEMAPVDLLRVKVVHSFKQPSLNSNQFWSFVEFEEQLVGMRACAQGIEACRSGRDETCGSNLADTRFSIPVRGRNVNRSRSNSDEIRNPSDQPLPSASGCVNVANCHQRLSPSKEICTQRVLQRSILPESSRHVTVDTLKASSTLPIAMNPLERRSGNWLSQSSSGSSTLES